MRAGALKERNSHIFERPEHDHFVEPEWCSRRLFDVEKFNGLIWDPCCGFGRIPEAARAAGYGVLASDIVHRGYSEMGNPIDFLNFRTAGIYNLVTNPPFDLFKEFALRALDSDAPKVAMIWLVRTLPAARWLRDTPLARILLLTPRPSMPPGYTITAGEKPGGGKQDFCWLIWDKSHDGPASIGWLHRDNQ